MDNEVIVIDGTNKVMGRLASVVAKLLLQGKKVVVVNAKNIIITGNRDWVLEHWYEKISRSDIANPRRYGPKISVRPDFFFKRVVRGMLPRKQYKGRMALKRLKVYISVPEEFKNVEYYEVEQANLKSEYITRKKVIRLGELLKHFGWKGEV